MSAEVKAILEAVQKLNPEQRVELERELQAMREQLLDSVCGKYRFVPTSVDEFLKRKHEELDEEERRWNETHPAGV